MNPRDVSLRIKQSKMDPFHHEYLYPEQDGVASLRRCCSAGDADGPLFLLRGQPLTCVQLVSELHKALALAGFKTEEYLCQT